MQNKIWFAFLNQMSNIDILFIFWVRFGATLELQYTFKTKKSNPTQMLDL